LCDEDTREKIIIHREKRVRLRFCLPLRQQRRRENK
jgi:hypothetical protein